MSFTVTIVRHAQTHMNVNELIHSYSSGTINETGIKQAQLAGQSLTEEKFTRIYSSDMERTQDTAKLITEQLVHPAPEFVLDKRLREMSFGDWEGLPNQTMFPKDSNTKNSTLLETLSKVEPPNGETFRQTAERVTNFFQELCTECDNSAHEENVLIVTHGITIIGLLLTMVKNSESYDIVWNSGKLTMLDINNLRERGVQNTSKTRLKIHKISNNNNDRCKRKIEVECLVDISHLE